jgi:hypothetical protein
MKNKIISILPDALMLAGSSLISYAAWCVSPPFGFAVAGAFCMLIGFILSRSEQQ